MGAGRARQKRAALPDDDAASAEICAYIRGALHFITQRRPDVLTALANSASFTDEYPRRVPI